MSASRPTRRRAALAAFLAPALLIALAPVASDAQSNSFYGRENIQSIEARYAPVVMPERGGEYELLFGFVTSADRIKTPGKSRVFNGVALGAGGFNWLDADILGTERNAAGGYIVLLYQGYFFSDNSSDARAYLNWSLGLDRGTFWADPVGEVDPVVSSMTIYRAGLRTGMEFRVHEKYFVDVGVGIDARGIALSEEYRSFYPVMITVGVSRWMGQLKRDQFPEG